MHRIMHTYKTLHQNQSTSFEMECWNKILLCTFPGRENLTWTKYSNDWEQQHGLVIKQMTHNELDNTVEGFR
jgi:hypothetical protein